MKNIYITDLDHTFLRTDLSVSSFTKEVWNSVAAHSIVSIATARTYKKTVQFLGGVDLNAPMILLDGALIATMDKKIIDTKFLSKEVADAIIDEGGKFGIFPFVLALADKNLNELFLHSNILNSDQKKVLSRYSKDDNLRECGNIRAMDNNFKIVYFGEEELLRKLSLHLEAIFGDTLKYILAPEAYVGCYFLTLLHKDADKSHAIRSVSEYVGFDLSKLTVFGDNFNDIGMFELAGISVAVANAQEGVKKAAKIVLPHTNDEDAVANYLKGLNGGY
ncbi:MAG: haloacid dehalogenase [Sulfurimonas sp. RIFOXYD12_FULL_33_39]|uniref:HAD-IIB family hydrolase n=1 Tax=unclassified Sulfurimonas TaxID=2623549 RepID=UPI0008B65C3D|nr:MULTISPECIES: HAD-IIB family hydrolase [unclassified Sulfurimonas]OHE10965.1 MAG: haloacid dehalogenase [Sulfurimonas sp. RIFOXYD12_FULL_33_39]OHE13266.1 MAG: haloacid dehalogenase [Sulfurimonas sp. RIFOXYD2_FULL_34_21]